MKSNKISRKTTKSLNLTKKYKNLFAGGGFPQIAKVNTGNILNQSVTSQQGMGIKEKSSVFSNMSSQQGQQSMPDLSALPKAMALLNAMSAMKNGEAPSFLTANSGNVGNNGTINGMIGQAVDATGSIVSTIDNMVKSKRRPLNDVIGLYALGGQMPNVGGANDVIGTSTALVGNAFQQAGTTAIKPTLRDLQSVGKTPFAASNNEDLLQGWSNMNHLNHVTLKDMRNKTIMGDIANGFSASGQGFSAGSNFGPWGAAIGAIVGGVSSNMGSLFGRMEAIRKKQRLNKAIDRANIGMDATFNNTMNNVDLNNDSLLAANYSAFGGPLYGTDQSNNFNTYLNPEEMVKYNRWIKTLPDRLKNIYDYDLMGYYKENGNSNITGNMHLTDRFKKPNHSTFSDESIYSNALLQGNPWSELGDHQLQSKTSHFAFGGYKPSNEILKMISNWEGSSMKTNSPHDRKVKEFNNIVKNKGEYLTQGQLDALYSYYYNLKPSTFNKSITPLLKQLKSNTDYDTLYKIKNNINVGMDNTNLPGLKVRRLKEQDIFDPNKILQEYKNNNNLVSINTNVPTNSPVLPSNKLNSEYINNVANGKISLEKQPNINIPETLLRSPQQMLNPSEVAQENFEKFNSMNSFAQGGGLNRRHDYKSSKKPYPSVKSKDFAGGGRSYPIPTKCLSGDTKIALLNGKDECIKDIVGKEVWIYSYDSDKRVIVPALATNIHCTIENSIIYIITLDNGESIECTDNHPFLLRDGITYKMAKDLKNGDSLMPLYRRQKSMYHKNVESTKATYEEIKQPFYDFWEFTHRMVWRELNGCVIPDKYHIHHIDGNAHNNNPDNIKCCSQAEHAKIHALNRDKVGDRDYTSYRWDDENARFKASERMRKENKLRVLSGQMEDISKKISEVKKQRNFEKIKYEIDEAYKLYLSGYTLAQLRDWWKVSDVKVVKSRFKRAGYNLREGSAFNHKVISVKQAEYKKNVYDLTINKYHNFALSSGVFVHNSDAVDALRLAGLHHREDIRAKVYKKYPSLRKAFGGNLYDLGGDIDSVIPDEYQHGGDFSNGVTIINNGGTHEQNPLTGVPFGQSQDGNENLVEQGEVIYNDYVYSNRLFPNKEAFDLVGLPSKYKNYSFAKAAEDASKESSLSPNDPISQNGLKASMKKLQILQEITKQIEGINDNNTKFVTGGTINKNILNRKKSIRNKYDVINQIDSSSIMPKNYGLGEENLSGIKNKFVPNYTKTSALSKVLDYIKNNTNKGNLRYAPAVGGGIGVLSDLLGLTNKPDYKNANKVEQYANSLQNIKFNPVGNYLGYTPLDRDFYINKLNAQSAAARDNIINTSGGNRANALAGILASDYNYNQGVGQLARQAEEYNLNQKQNVENFNRGTNEFNSEGFLKSDSINKNTDQLRLSALLEASKMRDQQDIYSSAARSTNLTNFLNSLGNIGLESYNRNTLNNMAENDVFGRGAQKVFDDNSTTKQAFGGKINRKKRIQLTDNLFDF